MDGKLRDALATLLDTQPSLERLPPRLKTAVGIDDEVFIFISSFGQFEESVEILLEFILVKEIEEIVSVFNQIPGLLYKRFPIDTANQIRFRLLEVGTEVAFLRSDRIMLEAGRVVVEDEIKT